MATPETEFALAFLKRVYPNIYMCSLIEYASSTKRSVTSFCRCDLTGFSEIGYDAAVADLDIKRERHQSEAIVDLKLGIKDDLFYAQGTALKKLSNVRSESSPVRP